jgi:AraC-binding-like domain
MTLLIDTDAVPASDRVEFWAKSSCDAYHPLHIGTDATDRFWARMWADGLGSVGVYRIAAGANTMRRTPRDIAAGDPECLHLSVLLRGRLHGAQQHRATVLGPGDITSYDTSAPAIFRAGEPFDLLVIRLPKAALGKHASKLSRLTAVRIPGDAGLPRLAGRFFIEAAPPRPIPKKYSWRWPGRTSALPAIGPPDSPTVASRPATPVWPST